MASLKEIKGRIASIQSTQKITSAMRMVASAKLHRTQGMTENFLRYMDSLRDIMNNLNTQEDSSVPPAAPSRPLMESTGLEDKMVLIPISSNSGLCGAFNSNIAKATFRRIEELKQQGADVALMPIGKKIVHELKKENIDCNLDYSSLMERIEKGDALPHISTLINTVLQQYEAGTITNVEFIYHHFKSMGCQVITTKELPLQSPVTHTSRKALPIEGEMSEGQRGSSFLTEPSAEELIQSLFPRLLNAEVYGTLLDSLTSEHASRMLAMQTADDNANELLKELTLLYNKTRQQAITNELIDIMGGKAQE